MLVIAGAIAVLAAIGIAVFFGVRWKQQHDFDNLVLEFFRANDGIAENDLRRPRGSWIPAPGLRSWEASSRWRSSRCTPRPWSVSPR